MNCSKPIFLAVCAAIVASSTAARAEESRRHPYIVSHRGGKRARHPILNSLKEKGTFGRTEKDPKDAAIKRSVNTAKNPAPVDGLVTGQRSYQGTADRPHRDLQRRR